MDEIGTGRKRTHWMWFVFPQLRGLGHSEKSVFYGIRNLEEAKHYIAHPILGPRLEQATRSVLAAPTPPRELFGEVDYQKFVSCMTLFTYVSPRNSVFHLTLRAFSTADERTIEMLGEEHDAL